MRHTHKLVTSGIAALALALGTAAPAGAIVVDQNAQGSLVPAGVNVQPPVQTTAHHNNGSGGSDWGYIAAGAGAASLALIGIGGTVAERRHRRTRQSTVAA